MKIIVNIMKLGWRKISWLFTKFIASNKLGKEISHFDEIFARSNPENCFIKNGENFVKFGISCLRVCYKKWFVYKNEPLEKREPNVI